MTLSNLIAEGDVTDVSPLRIDVRWKGPHMSWCSNVTQLLAVKSFMVCLFFKNIISTMICQHTNTVPKSFNRISLNVFHPCFNVSLLFYCKSLCSGWDGFKIDLNRIGRKNQTWSLFVWAQTCACGFLQILPDPLLNAPININKPLADVSRCPQKTSTNVWLWLESITHNLPCLLPLVSDSHDRPISQKLNTSDLLRKKYFTTQA